MPNRYPYYIHLPHEEDIYDPNYIQFLEEEEEIYEQMEQFLQGQQDQDERHDKRARTEEGEASSSTNRDDGIDGFSGDDWNRTEIDGLFCPICMDAWTSGGDHQVCCLPCGHIYGMSCIKRWLQECRSSGKCPQCNMKCKLKDVRKLYASRIVVVDEESQKKIRSLEAKCASLEKKGADWCKKQAEWQKAEVDYRLEAHQLMERTTRLERLVEDMQSRPSGLVSASGGFQRSHGSGYKLGSNFFRQGSCSFVLEKELRVDGARFFDVDASSQILIIARRVNGMGGMHVLTKMSLIPPHESEDIFLPPSTKAVRDLHISTYDSKHALVASLGKKLSVLSMENNHIVVTYDLPDPAWSCAWDLHSSYYLYAGLQNGMLLVFDMRQTARPMQSMSGFTRNPVHTIHSLAHDPALPSGVRTLLSASSVGLSEWNFGGVQDRSFLIPETENQGVCISVAYCPRSDDIVASFRPKVEMCGENREMAVSQALLTPSSTGQGIQGSHILFNRVRSSCYHKLGSACANVNDIRLLKSAIIDVENQNRIFASGDELAFELVLQDLPSFTAVQHLKSHKHFIRDVKYNHTVSKGLLSCLSEDTLQLFRAGLS